MSYYKGYRKGYYRRHCTGEGFIYWLILAGIVILMIALPTMDEVKNFFSTKKTQVETSQRTTKEEKEDWRKGEDNSSLPADFEENRTEQSGMDYDTELSPAGDINEF